MTTTIQYAQIDDRIVGLGDVLRGQKGLTCITCGDRLIVKDGQGSLAKVRSPRSAPKTKHFSHTSNSQCHGEGPAHYSLKMDIAESIRRALDMPPERRNFHGQIFYRCPNEKYGVHCIDKSAPPSNFRPKMMPEFQLGYHNFDLLKQLTEVKTEARLADGKTRADIAGFNHQGKPIWIIEIVRSTLSDAATDNAQNSGLPLFIIDISTLPKGNEPPFPAELNDNLYVTMAGNIANGFYPTADTVYNVPCEREAFGMGPKDHQWSKEEAYLHVSAEDCTKTWIAQAANLSSCTSAMRVNRTKAYAPTLGTCSKTGSPPFRCTRCPSTWPTATSPISPTVSIQTLRTRLPVGSPQ